MFRKKLIGNYLSYADIGQLPLLPYKVYNALMQNKFNLNWRRPKAEVVCDFVHILQLLIEKNFGCPYSAEELYKMTNVIRREEENIRASYYRRFLEILVNCRRHECTDCFVCDKNNKYRCEFVLNNCNEIIVWKNLLVDKKHKKIYLLFHNPIERRNTSW